MQELTAVFKNEEAARLLDYFIFYKEIVNRNENHNNSADVAVKIEVLPRTELLAVK